MGGGRDVAQTVHVLYVYVYRGRRPPSFNFPSSLMLYVSMEQYPDRTMAASFAQISILCVVYIIICKASAGFAFQSATHLSLARGVLKERTSDINRMEGRWYWAGKSVFQMSSTEQAGKIDGLPQKSNRGIYQIQTEDQYK